jgi:6-phosphofructokinase
VRPDVLQRCSSGHVTAFDRAIASQVGTAAVDLVERAANGAYCMVGLRRCRGEWRTEPVPLDQVRGERTLPPELVADPERLRATIEGLT